MSIFSFNYAILSWVSNTSALMNNSIILKAKVIIDLAVVKSEA